MTMKRKHYELKESDVVTAYTNHAIQEKKTVFCVGFVIFQLYGEIQRVIVLKVTSGRVKICF